MVTKFMTNIDSCLYDFIDKESKSKSISKREFLESIISMYIEIKKNNEHKNLYKKMWNDKDYLDEMQNNTLYLGNL